MMRALLISPSSVGGGAERVFTGLARHLPAQGVDVTAVLLQRGPLERWLQEARCPVEVLEAGRARQLPRTASVIRELAARARDVDLVVSNQAKGHVYGGLAAALARVPAVWWQHGSPTRGGIDLVAGRVPARAIVCYTQQIAEAQRQVARGSEIVVIPGGIAVADIEERAGSGAAVRAEQGWTDDPVVGIVGRLQSWKGQDTFLRAAAIVAETVSRARFVVVGEPTHDHDRAFAQSLHDLSEQLGLAGRTTFAGHQDDPYPWFDAFDVVVHASHDEPFGLVVLEAMALGKPVVATAAGGPREIIEPGRSGLLVPPRDPARMARAIETILSEPNVAASLGQAAQRRARQFPEEKMAERLARVVEPARAPSPSDAARPCDTRLEERTPPGLHEHLVSEILATGLVRAGSALDLGAGSGAFAERLAAMGFAVLACDEDDHAFHGKVPFRRVDLNDPCFADILGVGRFDLVTAIEVVEHVEAPVSFLRNVARLLASGGVAVLTTPNVDSLAARTKFLVKGKVRGFDRHDDPSHVSPIYWDLLVQQYLPRAGLEVASEGRFPRRGHSVGRPTYRRVLNELGRAVPKNSILLGDSHVLVLRRCAR